MHRGASVTGAKRTLRVTCRGKRRPTFRHCGPSQGLKGFVSCAGVTAHGAQSLHGSHYNGQARDANRRQHLQKHRTNSHAGDDTSTAAHLRDLASTLMRTANCITGSSNLKHVHSNRPSCTGSQASVATPSPIHTHLRQGENDKPAHIKVRAGLPIATP